MSFDPYIPTPVAVLSEVSVPVPGGDPLRGVIATFSEGDTQGPSHVSLLETKTPNYFSSSYDLRKYGADKANKEWVSDTFETEEDASAAAVRALEEIAGLV